MIYEAEGRLDIDGTSYRSIWVVGDEDELDGLLAREAPEKGWQLHRRESGRVLLRKSHEAAGSEVVRTEARAVVVDVETDEDWRKRAAGLIVSEGCVICARCKHVDRTQQMEEFVHCGSSKSASNFVKKHQWLSPFFPRQCDDYAAATADSSGAKQQRGNAQPR